MYLMLVTVSYMARVDRRAVWISGQSLSHPSGAIAVRRGNWLRQDRDITDSMYHVLFERQIDWNFNL